MQAALQLGALRRFSGSGADRSFVQWTSFSTNQMRLGRARAQWKELRAGGFPTPCIQYAQALRQYCLNVPVGGEAQLAALLQVHFLPCRGRKLTLFMQRYHVTASLLPVLDGLTQFPRGWEWNQQEMRWRKQKRQPDDLKNPRLLSSLKALDPL